LLRVDNDVLESPGEQSSSEEAENLHAVKYQAACKIVARLADNEEGQGHGAVVVARDSVAPDHGHQQPVFHEEGALV
jgi:hypothetical protein